MLTTDRFNALRLGSLQIYSLGKDYLAAAVSRECGISAKTSNYYQKGLLCYYRPLWMIVGAMLPHTEFCEADCPPAPLLRRL